MCKFGGFDPAALLDHERRITGRAARRADTPGSTRAGEHTVDGYPCHVDGELAGWMVKDINVDAPSADHHIGGATSLNIRTHAGPACTSHPRRLLQPRMDGDEQQRTTA